MTPTEQDNELFELCKQVYQATGWSGTDLLFYHVKRAKKDMRVIGNKGIEYYGKSLSNFNPKQDDNDAVIPLYTSDYILEKLPRTVKFYGDPSSMSGSGYSYLSIERPVTSNWCASYRYEGYPIHCGFGDTPLEALLKLTLKLYEEKIL